jgi:hypothetical protein
MFEAIHQRKRRRKNNQNFMFEPIFCPNERDRAFGSLDTG